MPEAAVLTPPPKPAAPAPTPAPVPAAPPSPKQTAMERAQASLENFTDGKKPEPAKAPEPKPKDEPKQTPQDVKAAPTPAAEPTAKEAGKEPAKEPASGKENPWELVKTYKGKAAQLEKELADARNGNSPQLQEQVKSYKDRAEAAEKRAKELADHMRFVDYQKSDDFVKNHQQPWERACAKAAKDLNGLSIEDQNGATRKATINDLMSLCSMDLGQARQQANAWFGEAASDVMLHRTKLNELLESQQQALEEAKNGGETRMRQQAEAVEKMRDETNGLWQKFNQEALDKYEFLKPKDGDEEHNTKLEKATTFVSSAMSRNPMDPKLSPEDRARAIKEFVAVRNRAIGYSALKLENDRLKAKVSEHEKALKEFQASEPTPGTGKKDGALGQPVNALEAATSRLEAHYVT